MKVNVAETLEIYNNGMRVIIEDDIVPIQLIFKNGLNEITGHSIISIDRLKNIMASADAELSWYNPALQLQSGLVPKV